MRLVGSGGDEDDSVGDAFHGDGRPFVDESSHGAYFHHLPVDFGIADESQPGDSYAVVARMHVVVAVVTHGRVNVFRECPSFQCFGAEHPQQDASARDESDEKCEQASFSAQMDVGVDIGCDEADRGTDAGDAESGEEIDFGHEQDESDQ